MRFSLPRTPVLFLYGLAAAFLIYWHWRHILDALPFLVVLACPLMHLFMHHGHGHRQDTRPADKSDSPKA
ncbi:DUF2933 domain-containing protein [Methylocystis sp. WRRC1]|jgi:hypothetical protein|uniref:DUF2933 domain-containing protein n=1 Tax=Methylocystis sp. WRRC1 TaxID=1732014 RepID=UPI001D141814|nr:DUF2933 domain-containing protein [Methylocystis sp. WRRC1]MCC3247463.1 DUF2933 domain-containing protein [Methylocystis sp. WRRC1]